MNWNVQAAGSSTAKEKNRKSTFALKLAKSLAKIEPVLYISAEEGTGSSYTEAVARAGITEATEFPQLAVRLYC